MKNLSYEELVFTNGGSSVPVISNDEYVQAGYEIGYRIGRAIGQTIKDFKSIFS